jgi:hypothetical protein
MKAHLSSPLRLKPSLDTLLVESRRVKVVDAHAHGRGWVKLLPVEELPEGDDRFFILGQGPTILATKPSGYFLQ